LRQVDDVKNIQARKEVSQRFASICSKLTIQKSKVDKVKETGKEVSQNFSSICFKLTIPKSKVGKAKETQAESNVFDEDDGELNMLFYSKLSLLTYLRNG
jgi:hypothetical protein